MRGWHLNCLSGDLPTLVGISVSTLWFAGIAFYP